MKIQYEITIDHLVHYNIYHLEHSAAEKRYIRNRAWLFFLVLVLLGALAGLLSRNAGLWLLFIVAATVVRILVPRMTRWATERNTRERLAEGRNRTVLGMHQLEINEEGVSHTTPCSEHRVEWEGIERVVTWKEFLLIYFTAVAVFLVPRASVVDGDFNEFTEALNSLARERGIPFKSE